MTRRKIILLFLGFLVMLLGTTYVVLQETGASRAFVDRILSRFIRGDFNLKEAMVDLARGIITLKDFQLLSRGGEQSPLLEVQTVEVSVITNPLDPGELLTVNEITLEGLTLDLDLTQGFPDLYEYLNIPTQTQLTSQGRTTIYPRLIITDAKVRLRGTPGTSPIEFTSVALEIVPESPGSSRMRLTASMSTNAGIDLEVVGAGDPDKGEFRAVVKLADVPLTPELARLVRPDLEPELEKMGLRGHIDRLSLWIQYPSPSEGELDEPVLGGGLSAELSDLTFRLAPFPYPVRGATAKISASTRDGGTFKFDLKRQGAGGNLDMTGTLTNCLGEDIIMDLRAKGEDLLIGVDLREAIEQQPVAQRVWSAFDPRAGRLDVDIHLVNSADDPVPILEMDLELDGVTMTFLGFPANPGERKIAFPLPLVDAVGRVRLRRGLLSIEHMEANVAEEAGGGRMTINGFLATEDPHGDLKPSLVITGKGVQFSPHMRAAVDTLVENGGAVFDEYSPAGSANVEVRIRTERDTQVPGFQVEIMPLGASASFRGFPYRIDGIEGWIRIDPQGVSFKLSGGDGGAAVALRGRFAQSGTPRAGMRSELWLEAQSVPANDKLREAVATLSPEMEALWQYLSPKGLANCEMSLWKSAEAEAPSFDLRIDVKDGSAQLANFPIPLHGMNGSIFVHGSPEGRRTDISMLAGKIDNGRGLEPASFLVAGEVLRGGIGESMDITCVVRGLHLNQRVAHALDHNGAFRLSTWNILKPSGSVDIVLRQHQAEGADKPDQYLRVWLDNVRSDAAMLPQPATHITGEVRVINGEAFFGASRDPRFLGEQFGNLQGKMGSAEIICTEGRVSRGDGATEVWLTVASEDFPVDDNLANLMKGPLREAYLNRDMHGSMSIPGLTLKFTFPEQAEHFVTHVTGQVRARGVSMTLGTQIEAISGALFVDEAIVGPDQGFVNGHLHDVSFRILGHDCHGFQATYHADAKGLQMGLPSGAGEDRSPDLSLNLHGGTIEGLRGAETALQYQFRDGGMLTLDASFNGLSLSEFLRASGFVGNPFRGTLSGTLQLEELIGADFVNMKATANMRVTDADLGAVPAFTSIYAYMAPSRRPRFDSAFVDVQIGDRQLTIKSLEVGSPLIDVSGDGVMSMDGYLDMILWVPNLFGEDADWLVLPRIIHQITSEVVQFDVFGYVRNTRVRPRWPWDPTPDRQDILPIPAPPKKVVRPPF